jgi:SAM-dependent methyltransferase
LSLEARVWDGPYVMEGQLACTACARPYPITAGVPRLIARQLSPDVAHTVRNFGQSWRLWNEIDDERYRWQFPRWMQLLQPADFAGRVVLDLGCGKGRHMRVVSQFGASETIGIDLSEAVDVAFANTRELEHAHVVQGDIFQLPFAGGFELAFCIGVLHHTPDPAQAFAVLAGQVRPGGTVACWVYGRENNGWIVHGLDPVRVGITSHLSPPVVRGMSGILARILFAGIKLGYAPLAKLGVRPFYADYMLYLRDLGFYETRAIIHDHLTAPTAVYLPRAEVERWFDTASISARTIT